jgi:hypothetical protein
MSVMFLFLIVFIGGRDDGLTSSLMWLRDGANPSFQSLNFGGLGSSPSPWIQPRMDNSVLGLQSDMYQTIAAAAALHGTTKQIPPSLMQFQQPQNIVGRSSLLSNQIMQQVQPQFQQMYNQNINDNTVHGHTQAEYLQQQLQRCQSFSEQKPQLHPQQQQQESQQQQERVQTPQSQQLHCLPNAVSAFSQLSSVTQSPSSTLPAVPAFSHQQNFADTNISALSPSGGSSMQGVLGQLPSDAPSSLPCVARNTPLSISDPWSSKRVAVESVNPSQPHVVSAQIEQLDMTPCNLPQNSALAPLPGRGCLVDQDESSDPQNHLLFGVNIDSQSLLMQGGIPDHQNDNGSSTIPYSTSNFLSPSQNDFPLSQPLPSTGCLDESRYVPSAENPEQANLQFATFVKVSDVSTSWTM